MNKKFLNVILFSALMLGTAGTVTSCKDYDDDIDDLQTQIDGQKSELGGKVSAVEGSISSLQAAQSSLQSAIATAKDDAEKAALEAQNQAIETAKTELNSVKAELQAAIQANTGDINDAKAAVASVENEIESLQAAQSSLQSEIAAAKDDAEKAALEAQNKAIESAKAELNAVKAELQTAIQTNKEAVDNAVKGIEAKVEEQMSKVIGRIAALEAFQATTEEALDKLAKADETLSGSIEKLDTDLVELGQRLTAVEGQIAALENYKASNDSVVAKHGTAIDNLTQELGNLQSNLDSLANVKTEIAALQSYKASNEQAMTANAQRLEKLEEDLENLEAGTLTDEMIQAIAIHVEDIVGGVRSQLEVISVALKKQVTHVSLYIGTNNNNIGKTLSLVSAEAVRTWTFGDKMDGAISFTKGEKETFEDSFVIRVSPTTATLDKYMIKLVNSQMNDLSNLLEIKDIEPYNELLTRAVSANGLWKVSVKLKENYDTKAYHDAVATYKEDGKEDKHILYAVMVSNEEHDGREVISEYGLTLNSENKDTWQELVFNVDNTSVKEIKNRWNDDASASEDGTPVPYKELRWNTETTFDRDGNIIYKYEPWAEPIIENKDASKINVEKDFTDKRQPLSAYSVKAGKPFTVNFDETVRSRGEDKPYAECIRGFYVTLDEACAVESAPSEINAWKSYNIKGLNTVTDGSSLELTIPEDVNADGDYIGFRVYAVNYDGSLVDPDGKAFYVYVGETAQTETNLTLTMDAKIVVPLATTVASKTDAFSTAKWGRTESGTYELVIKDAEGENVTNELGITINNFVFQKKNGNEVRLLENGTYDYSDKIIKGALISSADITSVTTVYMKDVDPKLLKDDMTYTATITAKNGTSGIVAVSTIKFKKALPGFPTEVYPFTNILVNGNLKVYPVYERNRAEYDLKNAWHGIAADNSGTTGYTNLLFSEIHDPAKTAVINYIVASNTLYADKSLVNPEDKKFGTKYPMAINYNYGQISNKYDAETDTWNVQNWNPAWGTPFTVEFGNYVYDCTFAWKSAAPKVTYPGAVGKSTYIALSDLKITDWYNEALDLTKMTTAGTKEKTYIQAVELHFLTGANFDKVDEYYVQGSPIFVGTNYADIAGDMTKAKYIKLTSNSNAAQGGDVQTKVKLVITDNFGYKVTKIIDVPFTMTFQQ